MTEAETSTYSEMFLWGADRGWTHAAFVDAYGKEHERRGPNYPGSMNIDPNEDGISYEVRQARIYERAERLAQRAEFAKGWTQGRRWFHQNRYCDGTKIED